MDVSFPSTVRIPKIIMQTWKTKDIPEKWLPSVKSIQKYMPDWKHILMTDEGNRNFVQEHFPHFLSYFDSFEYPIQRADAIRYMWLYVHGGIYMDLDIELQMDLSSFFTSGSDLYFVLEGTFNAHTTNCFMASTPRHPFWLEMIEAMKDPYPWYVPTKHFRVMLTTGPMRLNGLLKKRKGKHSFTILPTSLFSSCSICDKDKTICSRGAAIKPLEGSSWTSVDTSVLNFCNCQKELVLTFLLLLVVLIVFWQSFKR